MIYEKIDLKDLYPVLEKSVILEAYCPSNFNEIDINRKHKAVLVIPGGAYDFVSTREGEPIALKFLGESIAAFVIHYNCSPFTYPYPLVEVFAAISYIRRNSERYHIDENKLSVCGFSAGGHLAAACSAYCTNEEYASFLNIEKSEIRINGCILGYPVISTSFGHDRTIENITQNKEELKDMMSIDLHITKGFPKTFIWHTAEDDAVLVKNSIALADSLAEKHVFFELHVYPKGWHGESLANEIVYNNEIISSGALKEIEYNQRWIEEAIHFINSYV